MYWDRCSGTGSWTPDTVTHPSTNRARRRLTSLIDTNALTTTPNCQPEICIILIITSYVPPFIHSFIQSISHSLTHSLAHSFMFIVRTITTQYHHFRVLHVSLQKQSVGPYLFVGYMSIVVMGLIADRSSVEMHGMSNRCRHIHGWSLGGRSLWDCTANDDEHSCLSNVIFWHLVLIV